MTGAAIPPAVAADAAAAAKAWLRAADGNDDAIIATLARSAIALAEAFCGRAFVARAFTEALPASGAWQALGAGPVTAITGVSALAASGVATPLSVDAYAIDIDADGTGWLRLTRPVDATRLMVSYAAGDAAAWGDLPPPVAQGTAMLVAHLFDHREGETAPPAAVAALWRPWRRMRLSAEQRA